MAVMPHTTAVGAAAAAEKLRQALEDFEHQSAGQVTASFGVAERKNTSLSRVGTREPMKRCIAPSNVDETRWWIVRQRNVPLHWFISTGCRNGNAAILRSTNSTKNWWDYPTTWWPCLYCRRSSKKRYCCGWTGCSSISGSILPVKSHSFDIDLPMRQSMRQSTNNCLTKRCKFRSPICVTRSRHRRFFPSVDDVIMGHMIQADSCFFPFIKAKNEK